MGYCNPLYTTAMRPTCRSAISSAPAAFWKGAAVFQFYWLCFAVILAVIAHLLWPRGTDLALRSRLRGSADAPRPLTLRDHRDCRSPQWRPRALMLITTSRSSTATRPATRPRNSVRTMSANISSSRSFRSRRSTKVTLNVQLFPKQRMLVADGRYDLVNKTSAPISEIHVRQGDEDLEFLKLDIAGAHLVSDDKKFGYRIYRFDTPLMPGATSALTFRSRLWRRGFRAFELRRPTSSRTARSPTISTSRRSSAWAGKACSDATAPSAAARACRPSFARPSSKTCRRPARNYIRRRLGDGPISPYRPTPIRRRSRRAAASPT